MNVAALRRPLPSESPWIALPPPNRLPFSRSLSVSLACVGLRLEQLTCRSLILNGQPLSALVRRVSVAGITELSRAPCAR